MAYAKDEKVVNHSETLANRDGEAVPHAPVADADSKMNEDRKLADDRRSSTDHGGVDLFAGMTEEEVLKLERKLLWRIDLRMLIPMVLIYIMNYLDRNNASAARLRGFQTDLGMDDTQFATVLSILYVGYILMQIPSNLLLNRIGRPSIYLPCCMLLWGMLSTVTGTATSYGSVVAIRFLLGFVEAAFFPGALFVLSRWYTRKELALRTAILYTGSLVSNAINGLIAAGILNNMQGVLGHAAWRWLFFIEGAITMFIAIAVIPIMPDFPANTRWLSPQELALAQRRMARDGGESDSDGAMTSAQAVAAVFTDVKVWLLIVALTSQVIGLSFNAFFPTLTATLGYSQIVTLLLVAPPWIFAALVAFTNARLADRYQMRTALILWPMCIGVIGFVIAMSTLNTAARFVSLFMMASMYSSFVVLLAFISSCIPRPPAKRAVAIAAVNCISQLGNVSGSYCFPSKWGPTYRNSYAILISCTALSFCIILGMRFYLQHLNKRMDQGIYERDFVVHREAAEDAARLEGKGVDEVAEQRKAWRYLI